MPTPIVIDLSHHNVIPNSLRPAKAQGIIGVIHKASEGSSYKDDKAESREYLAREAGMMFGLYHFIRPGNLDAQVNNFIEVYEQFKRKDILPALDYEDSGVSLDNCEDWLTLVENWIGRRPVIYSGHVLKEKLGGKRHPQLNGYNYKLWLAQYSSKAEIPAGWDNYWLWQYTDQGTVDGVTPPTDLNAGDPDEVKKYWVVEEPLPEPDGGVANFGWAVEQMKQGRQVTRQGWNGKNMWISMQSPDASSMMTLPYIYIKTAQGDFVPWVASQTDIFAEDWSVVS